MVSEGVGGESVGAVGDNLRQLIEQLPVGSVEGAALCVEQTARILGVAADYVQSSRLGGIQAECQAAADRLERAGLALQRAKDGLEDYAARIGVSVLGVGPSDAALQLIRLPEPAKKRPNLRRNVTFFHSDSKGSMTFAGPMPQRAEEVNDFYSRAKQFLIERFPSDTDGLNIQRVNDFLDSLGLRKADMIIIYKEQTPELHRILQKIGFPELSGQNSMYYGELDLAFVIRDKELEALNGREITESIAVNEGVHGASEHSSLCGIVNDDDTTSVYAQRVGLSSQPVEDARITGLFWEEAFAEFVRALYVTGPLGRPTGFLHGQAEVIAVRSLADNSSLQFPAKYLYQPSGDRPPIFYASYAGAALDCLIARDPGLLPALFASRKDLRGVEEVARRINAIVPGLYELASDKFNTPKDFDQGLRKVLQAIERSGLGGGILRRWR